MSYGIKRQILKEETWDFLVIILFLCIKKQTLWSNCLLLDCLSDCIFNDFFDKVFLYDKDKELKNRHCLARTDPRMTTFDGEYWTAELAGEFVMYRDSRRQIAVSKGNIFFL